MQPENRLLLTDQGVKATASVFVDIGGGHLEVDQVNSIRHLVANAVQGLATDQVAVVDNRGRVLSEELKQDPTLGTASSQMRYRQQVEDYFAKKVESMLSAVIGPGNAVVRVSAEIETDATTQTLEKYDPEGQVVRTQTSTDDTTNSSEARTSGGAVGVSSNVPEKAQGSATENAHPLTTSDSKRQNRTTTYEINRTTTNVTRGPGTVRSLTAAVYVSPRMSTPSAPAGTKGAAPAEPVAQKRTDKEKAELREVVVNALGIKPAPGQALESIVTILESEAPFQIADRVPLEMAAMQSENKVQGWLEIARSWGAVGGAVIVLLVFLRMLSRQKPEPVPVEVLSLSPDAAARALPNSASITPEILNELIRQKPANIGLALRDWVAAGSSSKN